MRKSKTLKDQVQKQEENEKAELKEIREDNIDIHYCIFVRDDSPVSNLIGILNLLLGEITLWGADAADVTTRRREER